MDTATPLRSIPKHTQPYIQAVADDVFGSRRLLSMTLFKRRTGMNDEEVRQAINDKLLQPHYYWADGCKRKLKISKVSYIVFLKATKC